MLLKWCYQVLRIASSNIIPPPKKDIHVATPASLVVIVNRMLEDVEALLEMRPFPGPRRVQKILFSLTNICSRD